MANKRRKFSKHTSLSPEVLNTFVSGEFLDMIRTGIDDHGKEIDEALKLRLEKIAKAAHLTPVWLESDSPKKSTERQT